ncbi:MULTISPECIES: hypothetical protein [Campylobacter]|uniref:Uncharacterized protein n=2 Tax=Campylobacter TaxID=194 RepID=A0A381F3E9_CAMUP|nr:MULTISPECIES: hypothetical protein [Campylobacter]ECP7432606.1 hypothetical protein [Campylobacter jejuni]EAB5282362.1 hypothetical protein [Campylobacter upsaliensis]EAH5200847.1 hypothetical protein [Campylobacter upsaliensis]EAH5218240.1 hypothetical protein [Campylobacter upsaliensis]EAH6866925.1 hypothetical protein [Campylobacter upsaliensis]
MEKISTRIQVTLKGKSAQIADLIPKQLKTKAIEQALLLLAKDEKISQIFFEDSVRLKAVLDESNELNSKVIEKEKKSVSEQVEVAW